MATASDRNWADDFSPDEIRKVWNGKLRPISDEVIARQVSAQTRAFLTEVGLPNDPELVDARFVYDVRLSQVIHHAEMDLIMITDDESPITLGIDVATDRVYSVWLPAAGYAQFFNSNLAGTVYFLGRVTRDILGAPRTAGSRVPKAVSGIWEALQSRDPDAMAGRSAWKEWLGGLEAEYA